MEKFKDVVIKLTENASPQLKILIQQHLTNFTSTFHTPDHPPYAAMIHRAIEELNEKNGSSEESISNYIKDQHTDLPLAHSSLLKHHLGRLCDCGEIVVTGKQLYLLPSSNNLTLESSVRTEKDRLTRKRKARKGRGRVGKKYRTETDKHRETHVEVHAETGRNKENDEIIRDNNGAKINNKVDRVGELDQVVKRTEQENVILDNESHLHKQLAHAICAPVVDSKQPNLTSPDRPPGFKLINFQSKQKDLKERKEPEMIINSGRLFESETLPQVDHEQWRQGQSNCKYQLLSECSKSAYVSTEYLPSQNQQQQVNPSNLEGLQGVKFEDLKLLEPHKKFKQYGRRKKLTKEKEMQDVSVELEKKAKQLELSELDKSSQSFSTGSQQQLEFCKEKQLQESFCCEQKQPPISTCYDEQHIVEQHDKSVSNNLIEQQGTKKVGHGVRRSQRLAKSTQICTLSLDLLPSSQSQYHHLGQSQYHHLGQPEVENDRSSIQGEEAPQPKMESDYVNLAQKLQQLQLPAGESAHTTKQTEMVKTTKVLQRAKLRSWQKSCTSHENKPSGYSMALGRTEQVQQEPLCLEYHQKPVAFIELSMQEQAHETELEARTSTMDMRPKSLNQHTKFCKSLKKG